MPRRRIRPSSSSFPWKSPRGASAHPHHHRGQRHQIRQVVRPRWERARHGWRLDARAEPVRRLENGPPLGNGPDGRRFLVPPQGHPIRNLRHRPAGKSPVRPEGSPSGRLERLRAHRRPLFPGALLLEPHAESQALLRLRRRPRAERVAQLLRGQPRGLAAVHHPHRRPLRHRPPQILHRKHLQPRRHRLRPRPRLDVSRTSPQRVCHRTGPPRRGRRGRRPTGWPGRPRRRGRCGSGACLRRSLCARRW